MTVMTTNKMMEETKRDTENKRLEGIIVQKEHLSTGHSQVKILINRGRNE